MDETTWVLGPVGIDAAHRVTRPGCRQILVLVPTVTAGHRLLDLIPLLESDPRVQVVFSVPRTTEGWADPEEFVRGQHGLLVPWAQAIQHRFDLVLSASHRELDRVRGRILLLPHGAGSTMSRAHSRKAGGASVTTTGLDRELLTFRGRVVPEVIALTHEDERAVLHDRCPEADRTAVVTGDICLDRMLASHPLRDHYRQVLDVHPLQTLVTVSSTWTRESTFGKWPDLCRRLMTELSSDRYRVAAVLHPNIWAIHGRWQVRAWLADCVRAGLLLIPPDEGWQATVIASDWVIGDHGSTTVYAAASGRPVSLAAFPDWNIRSGSLADRLCQLTPRLDHGKPLLPQFRSACDAASAGAEGMLSAVSSRPGKAASTFRQQMYRLLELPEPTHPATLPSLPDPQPIRLGGRAR
jgi:hypothetical protein